MTDRELLELAAKACGYDISHRWNALRMTMSTPVAALCIDGVSTAWDPLADDGHALRLACDLRMRLDLGAAVEPCINGVYQDGVLADVWDLVQWHGASEEIKDDCRAATRRAIVRAAAEIGKAMP